jgi:hypothetical protein
MVVLLAFLVFASGCGKNPQQEKMEQAVKQMEQSAQKLSDAMKGLQEASESGATVEPVDFRELKKLLPEELPGLTKGEAEGEKTSAFGVNVSQARATYESADGKRVTITLQDMGTISGVVGMTALAWAYADVDRETETGYERTSSWNGHKVFERYDTEVKGGEMQVLVADRFIVEVEGDNVDMAVIREALGKINLAKLQTLKPAS